MGQPILALHSLQVQEAAAAQAGSWVGPGLTGVLSGIVRALGFSVGLTHWEEGLAKGLNTELIILSHPQLV